MRAVEFFFYGVVMFTYILFYVILTRLLATSGWFEEKICAVLQIVRHTLLCKQPPNLQPLANIELYMCGDYDKGDFSNVEFNHRLCTAIIYSKYDVQSRRWRNYTRVLYCSMSN